MDETGFKYDVLVTKFDAKKNRNERHGLTVSLHFPYFHHYHYPLPISREK